MDPRPRGEVAARGRSIAAQVAAKQFGAREFRVDVRDWIAKPLVDQDERRLVPHARREAEHPLQREDTDAEMHDALTERLPRGVGTVVLPDVALSLRQPAGNPRGDLRPQLVDGEPAPGQYLMDFRTGQLHRLGQAYAKLVQRRLHPDHQMAHRLLGRR
ncbi:hypothetical protein D9M72_453420 [compost metagenome]